MQKAIDSFLNYLKDERNYSAHTISSYGDDLRQFEEYVKKHYDGTFTPNLIDRDIVRNWMAYLMDNKMSPASINRKLSALKSFAKFLVKQNIIPTNILRLLTGPKKKKNLPCFVRESDMNTLLDAQPDNDDFEGIRNRLILEMLRHRHKMLRTAGNYKRRHQLRNIPAARNRQTQQTTPDTLRPNPKRTNAELYRYPQSTDRYRQYVFCKDQR